MTTIILTLAFINPSFFDKPQLFLKRYDPQTKYQDISITNSDSVQVGFDETIPFSDVETIVRYISDQFNDPEMKPTLFHIYKVPLNSNLYYAITGYGKDNIFLIRKRGDNINELTMIPNQVGCYGATGTVFFFSRDTSLVINSYNAEDGGWCGNYVYEIKSDTLKYLGEINVFDMSNEEMVIFGHNPMGRATAEYRNNTYYVTMRGTGRLYESYGKGGQLYNGGKARMIAPRQTPVTYYFDGVVWQPIRAKKQPVRRTR